MHDDSTDQDDACKPVWLHLHHMVSYCSRPASAAAVKSEAAPGRQDAEPQHCGRSDCVFRLRPR